MMTLNNLTVNGKVIVLMGLAALTGCTPIDHNPIERGKLREPTPAKTEVPTTKIVDSKEVPMGVSYVETQDGRLYLVKSPDGAIRPLLVQKAQK